MGKISPGDYDDMVRRLRTVPLLLKQLDNDRDEVPRDYGNELVQSFWLGKLGAAPLTDSDSVSKGARGKGGNVTGGPQ